MRGRDKVKVKQEKFVLNPCLQRARQCLDYSVAPSPSRKKAKSNVLLRTGTTDSYIKNTSCAITRAKHPPKYSKLKLLRQFFFLFHIYFDINSMFFQKSFLVLSSSSMPFLLQHCGHQTMLKGNNVKP